jgi:hypothetical protein
MPRFFFHFHGHGAPVRDEDGLALPDAEAAWYQAIRSARELMKVEQHCDCGWANQAVEIEDEGGFPVAVIPLQEIVNYAF